MIKFLVVIVLPFFNNFFCYLYAYILGAQGCESIKERFKKNENGQEKKEEKKYAERKKKRKRPKKKEGS